VWFYLSYKRSVSQSGRGIGAHMQYFPPVKATHYLLRHSVDLNALLSNPKHDEINDELITDILAGASTFVSEVLAPLNRTGDQVGATIKDGEVTTAPGYKEAYQAFVDAGWQGLSAPSEYGGMGLPQIISVAVNEMIYAANMSFGLCPMLTASALNALIEHGNEEQINTYLPKMITAEWSGGMNLTEPQAGSDLGALRAKAIANSDGSYAISGQKIFITWGEQDCTENIIHLVLARLPDAPAGSRGISLFLVPKFFVNDDGTLGKRNNYKAIGLEHKLGIHASPTCVMEFEGATGWMVGPENKGLACMFTMMNEARLFVAVQGVAIGERAYQGALTYAKDRVQGKVLGEPDGAAILGHPDVRRMLMKMKSSLMGARAVAMATAFAGDMERCEQDDEARKLYADRAALLTPIAKAYGSDIGVECASIGLQVHGGMGFIEETGAAQHYRDARIAPIYEGTNGIQAIDLVGRKLRKDGGAAMGLLIDELSAVALRAQEGAADVQDAGQKLQGAVEDMRSATDIILGADDKQALCCATDYLALCGHVTANGLLLRAVLNGKDASDPDADSVHSIVHFHSHNILPVVGALRAQIQSGAQSVFGLDEERMADL
jgi:alkylation response protein AidB-like acyl-CoA dehydrogenase